ncbi:MAG: hypothetical protein E6I04_13715 [Chloroflexi bacterium]|nr:MAG: hypothetical protein E6I04_13715 [Chloroflexota bacterium]
MRAGHEHVRRGHGRHRRGDALRVLQDRGRRRVRRHRARHRRRRSPRHPGDLPVRVRLGRPGQAHGAGLKRLSANGVQTVAPDDALATECDVLSPCAVGGVLNERSIAGLRCRVVAGGANNQLETPEDADRLRKRGIAYAPDFVINSGGVLHGGGLEELRWSRETLDAKLAGIGDAVYEILTQADRDGVSTDAAARQMALARIFPSPLRGEG